MRYSALDSRAFKDLPREIQKKKKGPGGCRSRLRGPSLLLLCEAQEYLTHKKASFPQDHLRVLGKVLPYFHRGVLFGLSEVPLQSRSSPPRDIGATALSNRVEYPH